MSIYAPAENWFKGPEGAEKAWVGLALGWCIVMSVMMPWWHFKGKQNSTGESYKVSIADFERRTARQTEVGKDNGMPVVEAQPGGDVYLIGKNWQWRPVLKMKAGQTYRLHVSSGDYQHGFSLLPVNMNFQALPGYDHVLTVTPSRPGEYPIICNEFCGAGHHIMTGKIIVE